MLLSEKKKKSKKLPIRKGYKKTGCCCESTNLNEFYSNPEFDDYARMVRNKLVDLHDVNIEEANYVTTEENTANFMHRVWFKMTPSECANIIADKLIVNNGFVDRDAYAKVVFEKV